MTETLMTALMIWHGISAVVLFITAAMTQGAYDRLIAGRETIQRKRKRKLKKQKKFRNLLAVSDDCLFAVQLYQRPMGYQLDHMAVGRSGKLCGYGSHKLE